MIPAMLEKKPAIPSSELEIQKTTEPIDRKRISSGLFSLLFLIKIVPAGTSSGLWQ